MTLALSGFVWHGTSKVKADLHLAQGLLLTTYMKLLVADPGDTALHELVDAVFERYARCGVGVFPVLSTPALMPCASPDMRLVCCSGSWTQTCSSEQPST